jgi:hypothetical protein
MTALGSPAARSCHAENRSSCHTAVRWSKLRVAGLCIGVDNYQHMGQLQNAVRDAEAVNKELRRMPGCYSEAILNPKTATELRHQLRTHLQETDLAKHPPELFVVYYAGHGFLQHGKMWLVPAHAHIRDPDEDLPHECLSLNDLLEMLRRRLDQPVQKKFVTSRAVVFLVVLDACCVQLARICFDGLQALKPDTNEAPRKYKILFSCSRKTTASDGPSGVQGPFVTAMCDVNLGFFAEGMALRDAIESVSRAVQSSAGGQAPTVLGMPDALPSDFCINPSTWQLKWSWLKKSRTGTSTPSSSTFAAVIEGSLQSPEAAGLQDASPFPVRRPRRSLRHHLTQTQKTEETRLFGLFAVLGNKLAKEGMTMVDELRSTPEFKTTIWDIISEKGGGSCTPALWKQYNHWVAMQLLSYGMEGISNANWIRSTLLESLCRLMITVRYGPCQMNSPDMIKLIIFEVAAGIIDCVIPEIAPDLFLMIGINDDGNISKEEWDMAVLPCIQGVAEVIKFIETPNLREGIDLLCKLLDLVDKGNSGSVELSRPSVLRCGEEVYTFVKNLINITSNNILSILDKAMQAPRRQVEAEMNKFCQNVVCALLVCLLMVGVFVGWANQDQKREL